MDKLLFDTKNVQFYFSTLQIGIGISYVPEHKEIHFQLLVFEFCITWLGE